MLTYIKMFQVLWAFFRIEVPLLGFTVLECLLGSFLITVGVFLIRSNINKS